MTVWYAGLDRSSFMQVWIKDLLVCRFGWKAFCYAGLDGRPFVMQLWMEDILLCRFG